MKNLLSTCLLFISMAIWSQQFSVRFYGNGPSDIDRIKIPLDNPPKPVDIGYDFTIEFWMKANPGENVANVCDGTQWYFSNIIVDRDVDGPGDYGDYGIGIGNRHIMVGVERLNNGPAGVCGSTIVDDGIWHHIAVTRKASNGEIKLFVDGILDGVLATSSAMGDISYRDNRPTSQSNSDPFLVLGAEKHDYPGSLYYSGWIDELRVSNVIRYIGNFSVPQEPFSVDPQTMALYHFNTGTGLDIWDVLNLSNGVMKPGGSPVGPVWSPETPFNCNHVVTTTNNSGAGSLRRAILCAENSHTITFDPILSGQTITLDNKIVIDRDIQIHNNLPQVVYLEANNDTSIEILNGKSVSIKNLQITTTHSSLPALKNAGITHLDNCIIKRNMATGSSVLINTGSLTYTGNNQISPD